MAKLTDARVATLKGHFNSGDQPTENQFANLIQWIQEGIEDHDHNFWAGSGSGKSDLGPLTSLWMVDEGWIGIGGALERIVFDDAGDICVRGAAFITEALIHNPGAALTLDAAGAITVTHSLHRLDTFAAAATDDLVTINGGVSGYILTLRSSNNARDITVKSTGNIVLNTAGDFTMTNVADRIMLQFYGAAWYEISRSDNA